MEGCKDCGCDLIGSTDLQCDATGQCSCLENVEGIKCDRCKENKYNRQKGCINCPDCYNLIQTATRTQNNKLERLTAILDEIEQQPVVISDEEFPDQLQKGQQQIQQFHYQVKTIVGENILVDQILNLKEREQSLRRMLSGIDEDIYVVGDNIAATDTNLGHTDDLLEEADAKTKDIKGTLENQGKTALDEAQKRSAILGQHSEKMTNLAHGARDLADQLDNNAENIVARAKAAKNASIEAYSIAKDANLQQAQLVDDIRHVKNDLFSTEYKLNKTKQWANEISGKAAKVKNDAISLLTEAKNLDIPQINILDIKKKSVELKEGAFKLSNQSQQLFDNNDDLRESADEQNELGRELLRKAKAQQNEIDGLRNDLAFCDTQANTAIRLWNEVLEGAETNYKLLTGWY